jgi:1-acyl-sn-glycerol-3-phosphate acyltransferase
LLIASNHPNSFLDAIILSALFDRPIHSLARGDAFNNRLAAYVLRSLHMLPVYRTSEGVENLEHNYTTFEACKKIFRKNGVVLIFSEGRCTNEWHLRPLKKGTARLAISSWDEGIDLEVLPCGLNYDSFRSLGKNVELNFGNLFSKEVLNGSEGYGNKLRVFNEHLQSELRELVVEIDKTDRDAIRRRFAVSISAAEKIILAIPAFIGFIVNAPPYLLVKKITYARARDSDHYDSILTGLLFVTYLCYLLLLSILTRLIFGGYWWMLGWALLPLCAWSFVRLKKQS